MLIDSHCHLADEAFAPDLGEVTDRARAAGVTTALCILSADEPAELARVDAVRTAWSTVCFAAAIHPHRAGAYAGRITDGVAATAAAVDAVGAIAVGEVGLDYHYDFAPRTTQQELFDAQVELAARRRLPIIVHTREATDDTLAILTRQASPPRGVMHCFTGTVDEARLVLDAGFYISLAGIVTFPKSQALRDVAAFVPADRLIVETDAPFLAPVPHRGKRNEPAWVRETLEAVARVRGVRASDLAAQIAQNFTALFGRITSDADTRVDTPAKPMV